MNTENVQDFILKNPRNLSIAAAVCDAWPQARRELIADFCKRLKAALQRKLKGWETEWDENFFTERYAGFAIWKPAWKHCAVRLECFDYGEKMIFGVARTEDPKLKRNISDELLAAVKKTFPSARARTYWAADITMNTPAKDWRKPEVLWRVHKDQIFLKEVVEQLLEVAKISEPILARLARKR